MATGEAELESVNVQQDAEIEDNNNNERSPASEASNRSSTNSDALEVEWNKVSLSHGKKQLLFGVSGKVKGKFLAIMGGSGSGKVHSPPLFLYSEYSSQYI